MQRTGLLLLWLASCRHCMECQVVLTDLRDQKPAGSLEPAEIAFGGPFIARGYLGRTGHRIASSLIHASL